MNISKKEFLSNVSDWCWEGNGRQDLNDKDGAFLYEPVCPTITRWLEEWVGAFNVRNYGFKLTLKVIPVEDENYYKGYRIKRYNAFEFPSFDGVEDEVYTLTAKEASEVGEVCKASVLEDEEPGSPYGSLTPELAHSIVLGYLSA